MQSECSQFSDWIALPVSSVPVVFSGISFILSLFLLRVRVRVQSSVYSPVVQRGKISFSALSRRRLYTLFLSGKLELGGEFPFQRSVGDAFILSLSLSGELELRMSFSHSFMSYRTNSRCASFYV